MATATIVIFLALGASLAVSVLQLALLWLKRLEAERAPFEMLIIFPIWLFITLPVMGIVAAAPVLIFLFFN